jgi:guanylate kinase
MINNDELLEYAEVYGNYYGTPRSYVTDLLNSGKDVVLEIDTQGAMQIKNKFPQGVFIYIVPPTLEELAQRIYKRGTDSYESIKRRLSCVNDELMYAANYNYIVVNDELLRAVRKTEAIIIAEKCRSNRNLEMIVDVCQDRN